MSRGRPPARARRRRADPRLAELGVDRDRAVPRGGRRVLVDRAERDRPRAGAVRARRGRPRHDRGRARVRPPSRRVPLRAARRAPLRPGLGEHDRPPLPLRDGRRGADRGAEGLRTTRRSPGIAAKIDREEVYHRIHAEMWIDRLGDEPAVRAGARRPVALRARRRRRRSSARSSRAASTRSSAGSRRRPSRSSGARTSRSSTALWEEMTMVRRSAPAGAQW